MLKMWLLVLVMIWLNSTLFAQVRSFIEVNKIPIDSLTLVEDVSFVQLISTPERYHGKLVEVIGYMNLEFEGNAIYLHREDFDYSLTKNGFWISFSQAIIKSKKLENYNKQYVLIIGIFDMNAKGHFGLFSGEIKDITRLDTWNHKR